MLQTMNLQKIALSIPVALLLLTGCGNTVHVPDELSTSSSALQTCTASCPAPKYDGNPITCTAETCSTGGTGSMVCDGFLVMCRSYSGGCYVFFPPCSSQSGCETYC